MNAVEERADSIGFNYEDFGRRLREAIFPEGPTSFARRAGLQQPTVSKYLKGAGVSPQLDIAAILARTAGVTLEWLVWGHGDGPAASSGIIRIPRYDATLAAGAGSWNDGRRRIGEIPFTEDFLRKRLNRSSAAGLSILDVRGASMEPTIANGALLMVDEDDQRISDDIFAFVLDGDARVKRFRKQVDGLMLISDNPAYPPEVVAGEGMGMLQVIGRALWVGQLL